MFGLGGGKKKKDTRLGHPGQTGEVMSIKQRCDKAIETGWMAEDGYYAMVREATNSTSREDSDAMNEIVNLIDDGTVRLVARNSNRRSNCVGYSD